MNMRKSDNMTMALITSVVPIVFLVAATNAPAQEVHRSNWVPNVGALLNEGEQPWTFICPDGGSVSILVDTKDDSDTAGSDIDPLLFVLDGEGNIIALADDNFRCTYMPVCGYACPQVVDVACGEGGRHSAIVRDFGFAALRGVDCDQGGGYDLFVKVVSGTGDPLNERAVQLGGGPSRQVPKWALDDGKAPEGPALDDEDVPVGFGMEGPALLGVTPEKMPGR